ncbi:MAG: NAD(P)H-binding protein [bacterium]|nr:NAD(P)H-binding protein [bacterium]
MTEKNIHTVTGAFGYSGKYIAKRLLDKGYIVKTATNSYNRKNDFGNAIEAFPFNFKNPGELARNLEGTTVLYNTYWIRFNHTKFSHSEAVDNTQILFEAAKKAGVERIVHVSITNPSEGSDLEYFNSKAYLEKELIHSGISYTILRPAVLFGFEDILMNNIAWLLRRFPLFGVFGKGDYRIQPVYVDDLAKLAVEYGTKEENSIIDAIGPETFTFKELVKAIGSAIDADRPIINMPPKLVLFIGWLMGKAFGDKIITGPEIKGLMEEYLYVESPPTGTTRFSDWIKEHSETLGAVYSNEVSRRINREKEYVKERKNKGSDIIIGAETFSGKRV